MFTLFVLNGGSTFRRKKKKQCLDGGPGKTMPPGTPPHRVSPQMPACFFERCHPNPNVFYARSSGCGWDPGVGIPLFAVGKTRGSSQNRGTLLVSLKDPTPKEVPTQTKTRLHLPQKRRNHSREIHQQLAAAALRVDEIGASALKGFPSTCLPPPLPPQKPTKNKNTFPPPRQKSTDINIP